MKPNAGKKRFYPRRPSAIVHLSTIPRKSSISMVTSPIQQPKSCKIMQNSDLTVRNLHFNISTSSNIFQHLSTPDVFLLRSALPIAHKCLGLGRDLFIAAMRPGKDELQPWRGAHWATHPIPFFGAHPQLLPRLTSCFLWFLMVSYGTLWFLMVSYSFLRFLMVSYG